MRPAGLARQRSGGRVAARWVPLVLVYAGVTACAAHKPLCQGELRPINAGAATAPMRPGARHGE